MLKVLHIVWSAHFGGIEKLVLEVCQEQLQSKTISPAVYFPRYQGEMLPQFEASGVPIEKGQFKKGLELSRSSYKAAKKIFAAYDVLHFHVFNPILARAASSMNKVIVYTEHGNFGFGRKSTRTDQLLMLLRARFLRKHVDKLLFNSHFSQDHAQHIMNLKGVNQQVLYNGVRLPSQEQQRNTAFEEACSGLFVIGTAARFAAFKRIELLLEAFSKMPEKEQCKLLLVGDGPLRASLEEITVKLSLQDQVIFTGYQAQVREVTSLMDVFAIPSQNEPFGLTVIEMMGQGTPVLAMKDGGGARELLAMSEPDNICEGVNEMAQRLSFYFNNREQISEGAQVRTTFAEEFTIEKHTAQLAELYDSLSDVRN